MRMQCFSGKGHHHTQHGAIKTNFKFSNLWLEDIPSKWCLTINRVSGTLKHCLPLDLRWAERWYIDIDNRYGWQMFYIVTWFMVVDDRYMIEINDDWYSTDTR